MPASTANYHCRPATREDDPALAEIYHLCKERAEWLPSISKVNANFGRDTEGERLFVIHEFDDPPLGFAAVWEQETFIHHLFIHPSAQGRGLGPILLDSLTAFYPRPWRLKCTLANTRAMKFYLSHGWRERERGDGFDGPYALLELA